MPYIRKSADQTYNHSANYGNTGELNRIKELERENQRLSDENSRLHDEAANLKIRMEQQKTRQAVRKNICFCYCEWARRGACLGKGLSSAMARYGAVCSDNSCEKSFFIKICNGLVPQIRHALLLVTLSKNMAKCHEYVCQSRILMKHFPFFQYSNYVFQQLYI